MKNIYTRDEAAVIVEMFEDVLERYNITVPSDEDDERDPDNTARLYGSTYYELLDAVEYRLVRMFLEHGLQCRTILQKAIDSVEDIVIEGQFSGGNEL